MRSALIGYTGLVGSNINSQNTFSDLYNSKNISEIDNQEFDILVCAGVSPLKWLANKEPEKDLAGIESLIKNLLTIKAKRFVLISTIDVYPTPIDVDENSQIAGLQNQAYGKNRLYMEEFIRNNFKNHNIIRLPGLFGENLKKNVIFDLLNDNCLSFINPDSSFQYYSLDNLWRDIEITIANDIETINFAAEPISTFEIINRFFKDKKIGEEKWPEAHYNLVL